MERRNKTEEEKEYSKREVDMLINSIKQHMNDTLISPLGRIEQQTTKTNGRVTSLEMWRSYLAGAFALAILYISFIK